MKEELLAEAINSLCFGGAICFLGAGFSYGAKDSANHPVPSTKELEGEIGALIGLDKVQGASLADLAEYCESDSYLAPQLRELLVERLTLCSPTEVQKKILSAPWRTIYTTNFDDIVEKCIPADQLQVISPISENQVVQAKKTPVYYLHGRARDMLEGEASPCLVLSESNYLGLSAKNRKLYAALLNDVHCARRIFFIGYSLKDLEIAQSLLSINEDIREKSYMICGPNEHIVALKRLEKFGYVCPVGIEGLCSRLPASFLKEEKEFSPQFLKVLEPVDAADKIRDGDVSKLMLSGKFEYSMLATQQQVGAGDRLYCVPRESSLKEFFEAVLKNVQRFIVSGRIGNGKSIFLKQLAYAGLGRGYEVVWVDESLDPVFDELTIMLTQPGRRLFIVDDAVRYKPIVKFIGSRLTGLDLLVASYREDLGEDAYRQKADDLGGVAKEIELDELSDNELADWARFLENWGFWEGNVDWDYQRKIDFLKRKCGAENRSIVVAVFEHSQVANTINAIVQWFLRTKPQHTKAFVAILISSLCQTHVSWTNIVQWFAIDERKLKADMKESAIFDFMSNDGSNWYMFTSTQLASYIFRNFDGFEKRMIVEVYTKVVKETAHNSTDSRNGAYASQNLKELMKYRFLAALFGEDAKSSSTIEAVYDELGRVPAIRAKDQFWLQWAMSNMAVGNLPSAERHIKNALGLSEQLRKQNPAYKAYQIHDQQARLWLLKNTQTMGDVRAEEVSSAFKYLASTMNERDAKMIYPLRSATYVNSFIDMQIDHISPKCREEAAHVLALMQTRTEEIHRFSHMELREVGQLKREIREARLTLQNA